MADRAVIQRPQKQALVETVGASVGSLLAWIGDVSVFGMRALGDAMRPPFELRETIRQLGEIGWLSIPLIAASGFAVGTVLSMHTRASLVRFGAEAMIPAGLALALIRETGPLTAGLLISGRTTPELRGLAARSGLG